MYETDRMLSDDGTVMVNFPFTSVIIPVTVPFTTTFAPIRGCLSVSSTVPVTFFCAKMPDVPVIKIRNNRIILILFFIDKLVLVNYVIHIHI